MRSVHHVMQAPGDEAYQEFDNAGSSGSTSGSGSDSGSTSSEQSTGLAAKLVSCLSIIRASSAGEDELGYHRGTPRAHHHPGARGHRLPAGCTFLVSRRTDHCCSGYQHSAGDRDVCACARVCMKDAVKCLAHLKKETLCRAAVRQQQLYYCCSSRLCTYTDTGTL